MSVLRIIKPWIRQYLNDHLIDHCVDLIEEQLSVEKSIHLERLIEWHNLKVGSVLRTLVQELELHLPADFFTVTDDSSSHQRTKKELKRLQKQLLRTSNDEKEKIEISTQTENRIGLQVKPLHELSNNVSPELLVGHSSETPNKKQKKNKKENSDLACSPAVEPLDNFAGEEREEQEKSKKKKKKKEELVNSNNQTNISLDHLDNDEKKLMIMRDLLLKLAELLSDENRIEFEEYYRLKMSDSSKGDSKGECESEENILNSDHRKSKKRKKRNSDVVQIVSEANPDILETEETRKKKKKKKRKSEGEDGPIITHIGSVNSLPESDNLRDTSKKSLVPTDEFHHELNPSYDSHSDSNQGNSPILLSHVMGSDVAVKTELSFSDEGPSNSAHPVKQVEYVPVPESSCALNVSNITCKSNPLHESLNIPESSIGQNRAKDTGDNLEKELLELEQCLQQVNKETDNQEPKERSSIVPGKGSTLSDLKNRIEVILDSCSSSRPCLKGQRRTFQCYKCKLEFERGPALVQHWLGHLKGKLKRLYNPQVQKIRKFQCERCRFQFNLKSQLKTHITTVCFKDLYTATFKCNSCYERFASGEALEAHRRTHFKQYTCTFCEERCSSSHNLRRHLRVHSELRPMKCPHCDATFKSKQILDVHRATHDEERPHACGLCGARFRQKPCLRAHMVKHTDLRAYACGVCANKFKDRKTLRQHMHKHSSLKPYRCELCEAAFKRRDHLRNHELTHLEDRPFKCHLCPSYSACQKSVFKRHLRLQHGVFD
ncbi:uncharacterized protein [Bemisia tabaci]|uniref:uncharacterized protein isoform X3 n=1 Tax=Bemisia tabaci TaxID=7038 RepID=UPI003B285D82